MHRNIETSKNQGVSNNMRFDDIILSFDDNGSLSQRREVDGYGVEVNVAGFPDSPTNFSEGILPWEVNIENITEH
jgi:hypothetical protein